MIEFVMSNQVTNVNGEDFGYPANPNGIPLQIPCTDTQIIGSFWRIPQPLGNRLQGYQYIVDNGTPNPPVPDAVKVLRVKLTNTAGITSVDFAILNADNIATTSPPNYFAFLCDGTGGTLPVMPTVAIPYPILQTPPQSTDPTTSANTFIFPLPDNPAALQYQVNAVWFNGAAPTTPFAPSGITTAALFATWANSNWSAFGTWSSPATNILKLVSLTGSATYVKNAGMNVDLAPVNFCFDLTAFGASPVNVNGVKFGSGNIIPIPAFLLTNNNVTLLNQLIPVMSSMTIFNTSVSHKLGINTIQATPKLYNGLTLVSTAGSGTC